MTSPTNPYPLDEHPNYTLGGFPLCNGSVSLGSQGVLPTSHGPAKLKAAAGTPCFTRQITVNRFFFGAAVLFTSVATAGSFFGWANMAPILESEGYFEWLCENKANNVTAGASDEACKEQTLALNGVYSASSITSFIAPMFVGAVTNAYGPKRGMMLNTGLFLFGALCAIGLQPTEAFAPLVYVTFICFGAAASAMVLPLYNYANLFPGYEGLALGLLNGAFDAGSMVYLIMASLYTSGAMTFTQIWIAYACGPVFLLCLLAAFVWRSIPFTPIIVTKKPEVVIVSTPASPKLGAMVRSVASPRRENMNATVTATGVDMSPVPTSASNSHAYEVTAVVTVVTGGDSSMSFPTQEIPSPAATPAHNAMRNSRTGFSRSNSTGQHADTSCPTVDVTAGDVAPTPLPSPPLISLHDLPVRHQIFTKEWMLYAVFFMISMLRYSMFIGTMNSQLNALGQTDAEYTKVFGIVLIMGFFVQFVVGPVLDRYGVVASIAIQWCLCTLMSVVNLIPSLPVHVLAFVLFACFRAFHFSNMSAYMARTFGYKTIGLTIGFVVFLGGLASLAQTALLSWALPSNAESDREADFFPPNAFLLALQVASGFFPIWLYVSSRSNKKLPVAPAD